MCRSPLLPRDETGVTLVEVLIAASLGVVVLALVGTMLVTGVLLQRSITVIAVANSQAENVISSFRNQIARAVELPSITTDTGGTRLLTLAVSDYARADQTTVPDTHCVAWRWRDNAVQMATYPTSTSTETRSESDLTDDGHSSWRNLTTAVSGQDSTQVTSFTATAAYPIEVKFTITPMSSTGHQETPLHFDNSFSPDSLQGNTVPVATSQCQLEE